MTKDEIIETAKQAGFRTGEIDMKVGEPIPFIAPAKATTCLSQLCNFAALVAAKEREKSAALIENTKEWRAPGWQSTICPITKKAIAAAIRARGEQA